jgi:hypothetical protein
MRVGPVYRLSAPPTKPEPSGREPAWRPRVDSLDSLVARMDLTAITFTELRYVVAVADAGHCGRAASRCHVTQPKLRAGLVGVHVPSAARSVTSDASEARA